MLELFENMFRHIGLNVKARLVENSNAITFYNGDDMSPITTLAYASVSRAAKEGPQALYGLVMCSNLPVISEQDV